jgi:hypothetical protein
MTYPWTPIWIHNIKVWMFGIDSPSSQWPPILPSLKDAIISTTVAKDAKMKRDLILAEALSSWGRFLLTSPMIYGKISVETRF